eukprot:TRINITY_DN249_c1_g3_i1.p1 TRINITY_DN249_c1_g3~~TRINITY_DN249_c1_g3_i1.p1  ORF type:complete len:333 (-),score=79.75 TRINITY_DN249_c1_g3_i1:51-992(-)
MQYNVLLRSIAAVVVVAALLGCATALGGAQRQRLAADLSEMQRRGPHDRHLYHRLTAVSDLPEAWDWRQMGGASYVTSLDNQRSPKFCGCCWGMASVRSLGDRIKIMKKAQWPDYDLSVQYLLNCGPWDCQTGASVFDVFDFLIKNGTVDNTCLRYTGEALDCSPINQCRACYSGAYGENDYSVKCAAVPEGSFSKFYASSYAYGLRPFTDDIVADMKSAIYEGGPIVGMMNMDSMDVYSGGIYNDTTASKVTNHVISIAGWGKDPESGVSYWIVANSMGTYWGDQGWAYIEMGKNVVGLEEDFGFLIPLQTW